MSSGVDNVRTMTARTESARSLPNIWPTNARRRPRLASVYIPGVEVRPFAIGKAVSVTVAAYETAHKTCHWEKRGRQEIEASTVASTSKAGASWDTLAARASFESSRAQLAIRTMSAALACIPYLSWHVLRVSA